ncbi:MAG: tRNA threonylcarbamoyladenosine dehydratase [Methylophilaceae bacterium]
MPAIKDNFLSTQNLLGKDQFEQISQSHICVIGLGGVGSWVVESLVRQGFGELTLIDMDHLVASNINRQIQAYEHNVGMSKIRALAERVTHINADCKLNLIDQFLDAANIETLIHQDMDVVIDAIDQVSVKIELVEHCLRKKINLLMSGGAGGRTNPSMIQSADVFETFGDPLLAKLRKVLKKRYPTKKRLGISSVFSNEQVIKPDLCDDLSNNLSCSGYGSSVMVTATMGFHLAFEAQKKILKA